MGTGKHQNKVYRDVSKRDVLGDLTLSFGPQSFNGGAFLVGFLGGFN